MSKSFENDIDFAKLLKQKLDQAIEERGKVNIVVAGKTGVGKSTLINAVFQGDLAETGDGRPVTKTTREIQKVGIPLSIFDTRGLEISEYRDTVKELEKLIQDKQKSDDPNDHIHVAWVCVMEGSRRVEDAEIKLVEMLDKYIPVVGVITKSMADNDFQQTVQDLLPQTRNVVRVLAKDMVFDGGFTIPTMGLENLVELTMGLVPDSQRNAFAAAQKVSIKHKMKRAHTIVGTAALAAGGAGAIPLPFSDAVAIIPVQVSMLASISAVWGLPVSSAFLGTLVSGTVTGSAATIGGRAAVGSLLKLIPGVGTAVGGAISFSVASTLTVAFGEAYIATLSALTKDNPNRIPTAEEIRDEFVHQLKSGKKVPKNE
ncbi:MAG: 50S ribosome-binding GTPase [Anaerolineaceae bacterium]|nr:50S ribosome-binding GTPase [Anaerolineaceae bacterium]